MHLFPHQALFLVADSAHGGAVAIAITLSILLVGGIVALAIYFDKKRTQALQAAAAELRLEFFPKGGPLTPAHLTHFGPMSQGHGRVIKNLMAGAAGDVHVSIFDYQYTVGYDQEMSSTYSATYVLFRSEDLQLPSLALRPEGFFSKIGAALGFQDIDFDSHPEFSKSFALKGPDEAAIRELFDPALLTALEQHKGITVEAQGNEALYYRENRTVKPEAIRGLLEEAFRVYSNFVDANKRRA